MFRASRIMYPEMRPKSFGTFEKRAPDLNSFETGPESSQIQPWPQTNEAIINDAILKESARLCLNNADQKELLTSQCFPLNCILLHFMGNFVFAIEVDTLIYNVSDAWMLFLLKHA